MQLAVITDEIDNNLNHALDVMAEYGITNAELRMVGDKNISTFTSEELDELKILLDSKGAKVVSIASPLFKTDLPGTGEGATGMLHGAVSAAFEDQLEILDRSINAAQRLGAKFIRSFTFWKHGSLTPEIEDRVVDSYLQIAKIAEDAGVVIVVENEHACYYGTGAETAKLLSKIDSPAIRSVWDPGNAIFAGEISYPDGYEVIKPYTVHVHVKDAKPKDDGSVEWVVVGDGVARWPELIRSLKQDGYDGYLSMETHYNGLNNKELSTRQCLDVLVKIFAEVMME